MLWRNAGHFAVERVYDAAQNNPGSLVRGLLKERVSAPKKSFSKKITTRTSAGIYLRIILAPLSEIRPR